MTNPPTQSKDREIEALKKEIIVDLASYYWQEDRFVSGNNFDHTLKTVEDMVNKLISSYQDSLKQSLVAEAETYLEKGMAVHYGKQISIEAVVEK